LHRRQTGGADSEEEHQKIQAELRALHPEPSWSQIILESRR